MFNSYIVRFTNAKGEIRSFLEAAYSKQGATDRMVDKLSHGHIANAAHDLVHLETVEDK